MKLIPSPTIEYPIIIELEDGTRLAGTATLNTFDGDKYEFTVRGSTITS